MKTDAMDLNRLPAEWEPQDCVLLVWPHEHTDWRPFLEQIEQLYIQLALTISRYERVIFVCRDLHLRNRVEQLLAVTSARLERIHFVLSNYNDTWIRDSGPITIYRNRTAIALDFRFNAWGGKYISDADNQITQTIFSQFDQFQASLEQVDWVLEGGAIESDGQGTLLVTSSCLMSTSRNEHFSQEDYLNRCAELMGVKKIHWINSGQLTGDDTDGHIDTLARFCDPRTIAYSTCNDPNDPQYESLQNMQQELAALTSVENSAYQLIPLPVPAPIYNAEGMRLPATYANFLIINSAVLVPIYNSPFDQIALKRLQQAFPDRDIIGIDCCAAIEQYGSLHCLTMQLPAGTLQPLTQE